MGGSFGSGRRGAEGAGGAAEEARAGAGREGDRHCGARAEHHHPSGVPGETQREKEERPLQEEQTAEAWPGQQLHQSALWWVLDGTAGLLFKPMSQVPQTGRAPSLVHPFPVTEHFVFFWKFRAQEVQC